MISLIIGIALVMSIIIGRKTKINIGLLAISFAYIIGCFMLKIKPSKVIALWPISIFFVILAISLFFGFAIVNGTLETLAGNLLYRFRSAPLLLPIAIFFISVLIAALGAGYYTIMVIMAPIALIVCKKININPLVGALCADCGGQVGSNFMIALNGVIYRDLITSEGFSSNLAFVTSISIFVVYLIMTFLIIVELLNFYNRKRKRIAGADIDIKESIDLQKAKPFDKKQKTNLVLIFIFMILLLVSPILHLIIPSSSSITFINSNVDVGLIAVIFTVIAFALHLGDEKSVIAKVPWNTLLMISGMGMLVAVAVQAGTIKLLANWVGGSIPVLLVPVVLCLIAAVMNIFGGSFVGVVAPALFPVIASVSHVTGLSPILLYTCMTIGGLSTGISPFSAGGAMILGFTPEKERDSMFSKEFFTGLPICVGVAVVTTIIYFTIMR